MATGEPCDGIWCRLWYEYIGPQMQWVATPLSTTELSNVGLNAGSALKSQTLVVSAHGLPVSMIMPSPEYHKYKPRSVPLVKVSEPPFDDKLNGDFLMPHNIDQIEWDDVRADMTTADCDADVEAVIATKLINHMYMEHSLQVAYTAATFFLMQNAVVKDTIPSGTHTTTTTLNFDGNTHDIIALVSTPYQNAVLTLVGCGLLTVGKTTFSTQADDPLSKISAPQAIASVMLDDQQFSTTLLHRRVVGHDENMMSMPQTLDALTISRIAVVDGAKYRCTYNSD